MLLVLMSCLQHLRFRGDCRGKSTFLIASPRSSGEGDDTLPSFSLSLSSSASDCTEACEDETDAEATDAEATTDPSLVDKTLTAPPGDEPGDADVKDTALLTPAASSSSNCMQYRAVDSQNVTGDTTHPHITIKSQFAMLWHKHSRGHNRQAAGGGVHTMAHGRLSFSAREWPPSSLCRKRTCSQD